MKPHSPRRRRLFSAWSVLVFESCRRRGSRIVWNRLLLRDDSRCGFHCPGGHPMGGLVKNEAFQPLGGDPDTGLSKRAAAG